MRRRQERPVGGPFRALLPTSMAQKRLLEHARTGASYSSSGRPSDSVKRSKKLAIEMTWIT
jgi:hypothetical protein